ncbi:MAG TPA: hypothetical protein PKE29_03470 [Phycisphaerales bacterium]|nr:hypothetical protein [Phycisphaerales bacterium]
MNRLREFLRKSPMLGWGMAAVLMLFAAYMLYTRLNPKDETQQLTQMVTIRCSETGDTWTVPRGIMEKELYLRPFPLDPNQGMVNPKTGRPTGFPVDAWKETIDRINYERGADGAKPAGATPSAPAATKARPGA